MCRRRFGCDPLIPPFEVRTGSASARLSAFCVSRRGSVRRARMPGAHTVMAIKAKFRPARGPRLVMHTYGPSSADLSRFRLICRLGGFLLHPGVASRGRRVDRPGGAALRLATLQVLRSAAARRLRRASSASLCPAVMIPPIRSGRVIGACDPPCNGRAPSGAFKPPGLIRN